MFSWKISDLVLEWKKKCTHVYILPSHRLEPRLDMDSIYSKSFQCFAGTPISHLAFFLFKPTPDQQSGSHCLMSPFLGYYYLPSLWSNYFSVQISAFFLPTLGFLQPIYRFYWCKIKLHSFLWFSPCSPLAHNVSVVYRPTTFSPAPGFALKSSAVWTYPVFSGSSSTIPCEHSLPATLGFL